MSVTAGPSPFDRPAQQAAVRHRPPRDCPVCRSRLDMTQLGCPTCGTGLTGRFQPCEFCGLDDAEREVLRVFLASRGNMKELERHLGVSYPTARARFDDLLRKLDLGEVNPGGTVAGTAGSGGPASGSGSGSGAGTGRRSGTRSSGTPSGPDPRLDTLRALASGEVDVDTAKRRLTGGTPGA